VVDECRATLSKAAELERTAPRESLVLADSVLERLPSANARAEVRRLRGDALVQRSRANFFDRNLAAAIDASMAAETSFEEIEDFDGVVRARAAQGAVFSALGHDEAALERLDGGARLAQRPSVRPASRLRVLSQRASALRDAGRVDEALEAFEPLLPVARTLGPAITTATLILNHAATANRAGHSDAAGRSLAEARLLIERESLDGLRGWLAALEGAAALANGDFERARTRALEGIDAGGDGDAHVNAVRTWAQAIARHPNVRDDDRRRARERLIELVEEARGRGWLGDLPAICRDLADLSERSGDLSGSIQWHKEAAVAREAADRSRRQQRLEAERLRIEVTRISIEAEQHRLRSEMLAEANARLAVLSEERAKLLAMVAHDLRSPLTAIGMCVTHEQRLQAGASDESKETLETIALATARMTELIDDALSTESIRHGQVSPRTHTVDLTDLVRRCVKGLLPLADRKEIRVSMSMPEALAFDTDAPALSRVVENLLVNALKFTPAGKAVQVTLGRDPLHVVLEVTDEGPGFVLGELDKLFDLGRTGGARPTAGERSSGIGLAVVRDLVRALGGDVILGNRSEGGARVSVRFRDQPS